MDEGHRSANQAASEKQAAMPDQARDGGRQPRDLAAALQQVKAALAAMGSGKPQPYMDLWADSADATLFGAWGPIERGYQHLMKTFHWVGSRFKHGALVPDDQVVYASGDLAYTVGFERGEVAVDDKPPQPMTIRVTHIYRRFDGVWRLVHRHADFPPVDQRPEAHRSYA